MSSVAVIIVNYNAGDRLKRCLVALAQQTRSPDRIVIVDNDSTDGSLNNVVDLIPTVEMLRQSDNLGFAAANNVAARHVETDYIALLNPDAYPEPRWLEELLDAASLHPQAAAFGSTQLSADDPKLLDGAGDNLHALGVPYRGFIGWDAEKRPARGKVMSPCAAAALYRRAVFLDLGGFDERFFCYCEDVDLGVRLHHSGFETVQVPEAVVLHEGSAITGRQSDFTVYHGHRNRVWLFAKAMPCVLFWLMLPAHLLVNLAFIVKFAATPAGSAYRRGIIDGLQEVPALRRQRRARPSLSSWRFATLLVWSPRALIRRRGKIRPIA